jgi:hypothetical protein
MGCCTRVPEIRPLKHNHLSKRSFACISFECSPLLRYYNHPIEVSMTGSSGERHFASVSSSLPAIRPGSLQYSQRLGWLSFLLKTKADAQAVIWVREHCHGAEPRNVRAIWLDFAPYVFLRPPQNIAIEVCIHVLSWRNKFLMHDALTVRKTTFIWECLEPVVLSCVAVNLAPSTEITEASSRVRIREPKIRHQQWGCRWGWARFRSAP